MTAFFWSNKQESTFDERKKFQQAKTSLLAGKPNLKQLLNTKSGKNKVLPHFGKYPNWEEAT